MDEKTKRARSRASNKYNSANYDRVALVVPAGCREVLRRLAEDAGQSVNAYILEAVEARAGIPLPLGTPGNPAVRKTNEQPSLPYPGLFLSSRKDEQRTHETRHTITDGGLACETVSTPEPSYDEYAEAIVCQAYAICTSMPHAATDSNYPIYRVTWHPDNDWERFSERERCDWNSPARIEKASGHYSRSTRQLFLPAF